VAVAHKKRAFKRKAPSHLDDTDLAPDIEFAEEEEGGPSAGNNDDDNGGIKIEPFNMKEERARGYFDEAGTYIEKGSDDDDDEEGRGGEKDAWLQGDASRAVVSEEVRQKILARQKQQRELQQQTQSTVAAASEQPLTATQIARLQWQVAKILHPGESITRAMKRLGSQGTHRAIGKRAKQQTVILDPEAKKQLDELTDVADALLDAGDIDVYTQDREHFKTAASVYIDVDDDDDDEDDKGGGIVGGTVAYEEADDDMFADDDMDKKKKDKEEAVGTINQSTTTTNADRQEEKVDYASWSIKKLRKFLRDGGQDAATFVEKSELVAAVEKLGGNVNNRATAVVSVKAQQVVPVGFAFDPGSGYWYNSETGMYFDQGSGYYFHNEKWYKWDGQRYVEISLSS
jgi:CD2 antigen cytoplasmic tail-binding protein 2